MTNIKNLIVHNPPVPTWGLRFSKLPVYNPIRSIEIIQKKVGSSYSCCTNCGRLLNEYINFNQDVEVHVGKVGICYILTGTCICGKVYDVCIQKPFDIVGDDYLWQLDWIGV
ncbi:hypothetical protein M0R19_05945 [Candidatus Pacearchaeota archaeon]|nr:hypothetical protein [Candidatus Pacearchaeota archaeon]